DRAGGRARREVAGGQPAGGGARPGAAASGGAGGGGSPGEDRGGAAGAVGEAGVVRAPALAHARLRLLHRSGLRAAPPLAVELAGGRRSLRSPDREVRRSAGARLRRLDRLRAVAADPGGVGPGSGHERARRGGDGVLRGAALALT